MTDRQFDALAGISRNMEKSLSNIEKSLGSTKTSGKSTNVLVGLSQSLGALVDAVSSKKFNSKKANDILGFSRGLADIANTVDAKSARGFNEFATGLSTAFDVIIDVMNPTKLLKLYLASKILFEGKNPLLKRIVSGMTNSFDGLDINRAKKGAEAINIMGEGLLSLTKALKGFVVIGMLAPIVAVGALVVKGVISLFSSFGKKAKDIKAGGESLKELGKGLIVFSAGLATIALVIVAGGAKSVEAIGLIAVFGLTFWAIGKMSDSISKGAKAVAFMGLAIFGFSAALAMISLVMMIVKPSVILASMLIIAGFALVFALIGSSKVSKSIAEGALILILGISVGLFIFSGALLVLAAAMKLWSLEKAALASGLILGIGMSIALIGKMPGLEKGVASLTGMGIGLIALSGGILAFGVAIKLLQSIFKDEIKEAGIIAGTIILGIGIVIGIIGKMPGLEKGVASLTGMGLGLMAVAGGILAFGIAIKLLQIIFKDELAKAGIIAGSIILGLGLAFAGIGIVAGSIVAGSAAIAGIGISLMLLSAGILVFGVAIKLLGKMFNNLAEAGKMAGGIILGLGLGFAAIGLLSIPIILGSAATILMGVSLAIFGVGLMVFGAAMNFISQKGLFYKNDKGEYRLKGTEVLSSIGHEFSSIGLQALNPFFWVGMAASVGMGASLLMIGNGLKVAADSLSKIKDMGKITTSLFGSGGLIPVLAESFSSIGKRYGGLASFIGMDDVSVGIRTVAGFGNVLQSIAGGIVAFSDFTQFPVRVPDPKDPSKLIYKTVDMFGEIIPSLNANLPILLSTLAMAFSDIGNKFGGGNGWFGVESPVQKGVSAVKGLGRVLSELAGGIIAFSRFDEFPVHTVDPKDPSKLIYKSINLWEALPKIKSALVGDGTIQGKLSSKSGILFSLAEIFAEIGTKYGDGFLTDGSVKKGVAAIRGVGGVLSELALGIVSFANMQRGLPNFDKNGKFNGTYTPFDINQTKTNIEQILTMLPQAFGKIDINKMSSANNKTKSLSEIVTMFQKFSTMGNGLKTFADALLSTGDAFSKFGAGFATFTSQLENFMKFEKAFSALAYNSYQYKFDKFAQSVGVLKTNINGLNIENLRLTDSLMKSLAILSKAPDTVGEKIKESIKEAMDQLINAVNKLSDSSTQSSKSIADALGAPVFQPVQQIQKPLQISKEKSAPVQDYSQLVLAMNQVKDSIESLNSKLQKGGFGGLKVELVNK